jgi:hypothetical protein
MRAILYKDDGDIIEVLAPEINYTHGYYMPVGFGFETQTNTCVIHVVNSFGYHFQTIPNSDKLKNAIDEYIKLYGEFEKVLFILNEIIVNDETELINFSKKIGKKCYYANFDMTNDSDKNKVFLPLSLYTQVDWILMHDYLNARTFLENMNRQYFDLIKPYKYSFYSNHISPNRIDIFNILKATDNLKNGMWSFNDSLVYYSGEKHNLDSFLKDNEGIIPHSFDRYSEKTIHLKHTYLPQFLCYFEIVTESYFFRHVNSLDNNCPITEKLVKPIVCCLPFIVFGPKNLKLTFESIGMRFTSPLYGFYDITNDNSCREGYGHVTQQCIQKIETLHKTYFEYLEEYENNSKIFIQYFINNKNKINEFFQEVAEVQVQLEPQVQVVQQVVQVHHKKNKPIEKCKNII